MKYCISSSWNWSKSTRACKASSTRSLRGLLQKRINQLPRGRLKVFRNLRTFSRNLNNSSTSNPFTVGSSRNILSTGCSLLYCHSEIPPTMPNEGSHCCSGLLSSTFSSACSPVTSVRLIPLTDRYVTSTASAFIKRLEVAWGTTPSLSPARNVSTVKINQSNHAKCYHSLALRPWTRYTRVQATRPKPWTIT
jgi:hypothetical protein